MTEPTYTFRQGDLPKLDLQIDRGTNFTAWRTQWEPYCSLSGLSGEDSTKQAKALMLCFSRETLAIVQNLGLTDAQLKDTPTIIDANQHYVDGHINETVECRNFRRWVQQPGESFDDFLIALRELVKTCKTLLRRLHAKEYLWSDHWGPRWWYRWRFVTGGRSDTSHHNC